MCENVNGWFNDKSASIVMDSPVPSRPPQGTCSSSCFPASQQTTHTNVFVNKAAKYITYLLTKCNVRDINTRLRLICYKPSRLTVKKC